METTNLSQFESATRESVNEPSMAIAETAARIRAMAERAGISTECEISELNHFIGHHLEVLPRLVAVLPLLDPFDVHAEDSCHPEQVCANLEDYCDILAVATAEQSRDQISGWDQYIKAGIDNYPPST